jgi:sugar phosphate permease
MLLLGGMICINYVDRFNIAAAVPTLMKEFGLSPARMGVLMSAFGWTYLICMFPVGYLLDRKSPKTIGFFSCLGWGVATLFTAAVSGFYSFFAVRLLLGATESAGYPTCTRIAAAWTPKHERTTATGVFDCSSKLGSAFNPSVCCVGHHPLGLEVFFHRDWACGHGVCLCVATLLLRSGEASHGQ